MKEYITTLIYIAVFSIVLEIILPDTKLRKYISTMVALLVVMIVISPIIRLVKNENVLSTINEAYKDISLNIATMSLNYDTDMYNNEHIKNDVKRKIELDILNKCNANGILANRVEVTLTDEYLVNEVNIYVSNIKTVEDASKVMNIVINDYGLEKSYINVIGGE